MTTENDSQTEVEIWAKIWLFLALILLIALIAVLSHQFRGSDIPSSEDRIEDLEQCVLRMRGLDYIPSTSPTPNGTELDNELIRNGACPLPGEVELFDCQQNNLGCPEGFDNNVVQHPQDNELVCTKMIEEGSTPPEDLKCYQYEINEGAVPAPEPESD